MKKYFVVFGLCFAANVSAQTCDITMEKDKQTGVANCADMVNAVDRAQKKYALQQTAATLAGQFLMNKFVQPQQQPQQVYQQPQQVYQQPVYQQQPQPVYQQPVYQQPQPVYQQPQQVYQQPVYQQQPQPVYQQPVYQQPQQVYQQQPQPVYQIVR